MPRESQVKRGLMKKNAWIVVANGDKARILKMETVGVLKEVDDLTAVHSHLKDGELTGNRLGRSSGPMGAQRHAMEAKTTVHQKEVEGFAKAIAHYLEKARQNHDYENLYLVAEPRFLGHLRQALHPNTVHQVAGEVRKDLVVEDLRHIWKHLPLPV